MAKQYTVSDGKLVLTLEPAEEGGYVVTSPVDSELVTEAETVPDAFEMARDALAALRSSRAKLLKAAKQGQRRSSAARSRRATA